jgi:peptidoglycan-associated lipoprotein
MTRIWKALLTSLVIVLVVLAPACKTTKKKVDTKPVVETTQPQPPDVAVQTDTATTVAPPDDFVKTDTVAEEVIPTGVEELNRWVHDKGYIRDAFFTYDESTLDADAQAALSASANWLKSAQGANYRLLIQGHCDERGTEQYNLALGDRRANVAKDYLATLGVDASRVQTVSYGEERPFEEGHDESAWSQNRRAHLVLVQ